LSWLFFSIHMNSQRECFVN